MPKNNHFNSSLKALNDYIDEEFKKSLKDLPPPLKPKMKYLYQGKRVRTKLIYNSAKIINCPIKEIFLSAFAVELIHTISLLHDDVIDDDFKRRGADTINSIFDNKTAIFLGNYLIQNLFYLLAKHQETLKKEILLNKLNEICRGELMQNSYFKTKKKINKQDILGIAKKKTGALFSLSAILPCLSRKMDSELIKMFEECGYAFGVSYQLLDDFKDILKDFKKNQNIGSNLNYPIQLIEGKGAKITKSSSKELKKKILEEILLKIKTIALNLKKKIHTSSYSQEIKKFHQYFEQEMDALGQRILKLN